MNWWHNSRLLTVMANGVMAMAVAGLVTLFSWWLVQRPMFVLREVVIQPLQGPSLNHASAALLKRSAQSLTAATPGKAAPNFFTVDLGQVRHRFEAVPWVRQASVRRIWPNRLLVQIEEHRALALWGDAQLLNTFGEPFTANLGEAEVDGALPRLSGPQGTHTQVLRQFDAMQRWLDGSGRQAIALSLSARFSWSAELDDGSQLILGRDQGVQIEERVRRWAQAYPRVADQFSRKPEIFDLRYPNGFAVRALVSAPPAGSPSKP
jgi:cell division protein FtsQ